MPSAVLAAVAVGDETWAIISQGPVAPLSPAGPVTAVELDAGLATVRSVDLGEGAWRGGFAVCVAT